jgi:hypothetical protein
MKEDFHYGVVKLVARAAGYREDEAQTIAYASQYTDDATAHEAMTVKGMGPGVSIDAVVVSWLTAIHDAQPSLSASPVRTLATPDGEFDPICTASAEIQQEIDKLIGGSLVAMLSDCVMRLLGDDTQKKIYIPFHFLPGRAPADFPDAGNYHYCTSPGGPLPRRFLNAIIEAPSRLTDPAVAAGRLPLIALGIAIHSYADTWAHAGFSGRWNSKENDIDNLFTSDDGFGSSKDLGLAPNLGHSEALHSVDEAHVELRFEFEHALDERPKKVPADGGTRKNWVEYRDAARSIHDHLAPLAGGAGMDWPEVERLLVPILRADLGPTERIDLMRQYVEDAFDEPCRFHYNKVDWENRVRNIPWTGEGDPDHALVYDRDADWFLFYAAALAQRSALMPSIESKW